jgi:hypothetical protein
MRIGEIINGTLVLLVLSFVVYVPLKMWNDERWRDMLKEEARYCLHEVKEDYTTTVRGEEAILDYEINGYAEAVRITVPSKNREEVVYDLNKSRMLGEWAGEKSTEFLKGFFKGQEKESKFPDYEE